MKLHLKVILQVKLAFSPSSWVKDFLRHDAHVFFILIFFDSECLALCRVISAPKFDGLIDFCSWSFGKCQKQLP